MAPEDDVFQAAVEQVLLDEGGDKLTDDPDDPGGRTKYGITQRLLDAINYPVRRVDDLHETDATSIYHDHFWLEYKLDTLFCLVAPKVFNFMVTAGPRQAFLCLQRAMRANGIDVKEDGVLGPITRGKLRAFTQETGSFEEDHCHQEAMLAAYKSEIAGYYRDLDKPKYEAGWVERAYR